MPGHACFLTRTDSLSVPGHRKRPLAAHVEGLFDESVAVHDVRGPRSSQVGGCSDPARGPRTDSDRRASGQRQPDRLEDADRGDVRWTAPARSRLSRLRRRRVIDEIGEGVTGMSLGDEVLGTGRDTQAEYAVLASWAAKPSEVGWAAAAAAGVAGETAERGLRLLEVKAGDTVFVDGGAGGVGAVTVQMAVARGAKVVASSSQANHNYLQELGATPVLYGEGVVARVQAAAGGPVDAVFDVAGKTPVEDLVSLAPQPSQVVTIANFNAAQAGAQVTGGGEDSHPMEALALVAELLSQSELVIKVQTYPFEHAAEAYRISQSGHVRGKLVLVP